MKTTRLQDNIYLHQYSYPSDTSYSLPYLWHLSGEINLCKLKRVLDTVFNIHDIYHMYYSSSGKLIKNNNLKVKSQVINFSSRNFDEFESFVKEQVFRDMKHAFNLNAFPLVKIKLFVDNRFKNDCFLYLNICHSICDVYSAFQLFKEISNLYNGEHLGKIKQFEDSKSLNHSLSLKKEYDAVCYFKNLIKENSVMTLSQPNLQTNMDYPIKSNEGTCKLPLKRIIELSKSLNASEFEIMLSIYVIFLSKITNSSKVITGVPLANRRIGDKRIHGCFVNTLPLILNIENNNSFSDVVLKVKEGLRYLLRYQEFDFSSHISEIFDNKINTVSFVNNSITFYKSDINFTFKNVSSENLEIPRLDTIFPLEIEIENKSDKEVVIHLQCSSDFNANELINKMKKLYEAIVYNPKLSIKDINSPDKTLIEKKEKGLVEVIQKNVEKNPTRKAVVFKDGSLSYQELDKLSTKFAQYLKDKDNTNIVVSLKNNLIYLPVLILGVFKANKTYVPLDFHMPRERKKRIVENLSNALYISDYKDELFVSTQSKVEQFNNIAYVLFTSGSTGIPKGVKISYKSVSNLFSNLSKGTLKINERENWINFHSYGFDYSIFELLGSLYFNGTVYIIPPEIRAFPDKVRQFIVKNKINILTQTPTAFLNLTRVELRQKNRMFSLDKIFIGGESLDFSTLKEWVKRYPLDKINIFNLYGVTEATIISTVHEITNDDVKNNVRNNIGLPLDGIDTYVIKNNKQVLPGCSGELYIMGNTISEGYLNYKNDRFFYWNGKEGFKTGDIVKSLPNGEIEYIKRNDSQVQIGGHRIELYEIQQILNRINDAEFQVTSKDQRILAYYISESKNITEEMLLNFAKQNLTSYMIPARFIKVNKFPLTSNGKIDFKTLNNLEFEKPQREKSYKKDMVLDRVIDIWKEVLKNPTIEKDDNFFDAGGSSLLISEMYYKILDSFKLTEDDLSMVDLFEYTTPYQVSEFIKDKGEGK